MVIELIVRMEEEDAAAAAVREAVARWRDAGHEVRPRATFEAGDARRFARAARQRADLLVVAGGDGTLNEVVNGLARPGRRPRLAIVPTGTANDFAAGIGLPVGDVAACLRVAMAGSTVSVDLPSVNGRTFVNVSVGGLGAAATRDTSPEAKQLLGPLAYLVRGAVEVAAAEPHRARFRVDGRTVHDGAFLFFAVGNGPRTGGGTVIAPQADAGDGRIDLVVLEWVPKIELVRLLPAIRAGEHESHPGVMSVQGRRVDVRLEGDTPVNVDGEAVDARRLRYRASDERVSVMVPADRE